MLTACEAQAALPHVQGTTRFVSITNQFSFGNTVEHLKWGMVFPQCTSIPREMFFYIF